MARPSGNLVQLQVTACASLWHSPWKTLGLEGVLKFFFKNEGVADVLCIHLLFSASAFVTS